MREVYPLVVNRRDARVPLLALAHRKLRAFAERSGRHPEEWPDMVLRVMLEHERDDYRCNGH